MSFVVEETPTGTRASFKLEAQALHHPPRNQYRLRFCSMDSVEPLDPKPKSITWRD